MVLSSLIGAEEPVDLDAVTKIRDQGFHHSQVMDLAWHLTEAIGPRLTGSPQLKEANEWTKATMEEWGLEGRLEGYDFGRGWGMERVQVRMLRPYVQPLEALPEAWSPETDGPVRGKVVRADLESEEDLEKWRGQLGGTFVILEDEQKLEQIERDLFERWDGKSLQELEEFDIPGESRYGNWRQRRLKRFEFWKKLSAYLEEEGVLATIEPSSRDNGVVRVTGNSSNREGDRPIGVPGLAMSTEHYNRLARLVEKGFEPELEVDVAVKFYEDDGQAYNTIADLKGSDLADEIVLVGGHLDSWHTGTGATDNAGSCAVIMEAVRILTAAGLQPRRTIRVAFWSGEENGLLGSRDYVRRHVATRPEPTDPAQLELPTFAREPTWPIEPLAGHANLFAYFNVDYGSGRIRGIYAQENAAAVPIFEAWLAPVADLGADSVTMESASGTDHRSFDSVGIPAFQFIQDDMDYWGRTHHSNVDTYDHLHREDLVQSAVVVATFLWHAANRDEMFPRKPMPEQPPEEAATVSN
jgi:hypothetical protein